MHMVELTAKSTCTHTCCFVHTQVSNPHTVFLSGQFNKNGNVSLDGTTIILQCDNKKALPILPGVSLDEARQGFYMFTPEDPNRTLSLYYTLKAACR